MLNIKVGTLSGYERNYRLPDARMLQLLAGVMTISSDYILGLPPSEPKQTTRSLPIIGTIKSSLPLLAPENIDGYLDVPDYIEADYVLTVKDGSMIEAGILEGDYVICRGSEVAEYQAYNRSFPPGESEDWKEIINLSSQAGLKAQQVKEIVLGQIEIARRLKEI